MIRPDNLNDRSDTKRLCEVATLLRTILGDESLVVVRVDEGIAAVQRLEWELERGHSRQAESAA
jgi:hypothetical protein